mgnify:CR=1 FL=1
MASLDQVGQGKAILNKGEHMKTFVAKLESISPYSKSRYHGTPELEKEHKVDYEKRTWRNRVHANDDGFVFIPPMAFKNCLSEAAKFLSIQINGKGKATYTKHFEAGVLITDPLVLDIKKEDVDGEWLFVPSDGKRGGGTRVERCFPLFKTWQGEITIHVIDDTITEEILVKHLEEAGKLIGIGRFRPRNNGFYGRFKVESVEQV